MCLFFEAKVGKNVAIARKNIPLPQQNDGPSQPHPQPHQALRRLPAAGAFAVRQQRGGLLP